MRLYLSSYDLGNKPAELVTLVGQGKKALLILNALDHAQKYRDEYLTSQTKALTDLGFEVAELDLRNYFSDQSGLEGLLKESDLVWINGGNTFILRRAMKQSGFDIIIRKLLANDKIVYGGFSAAVCVLAPTLKGLDITDDANKTPEGYDPEIIWEGLGLIDYSVAVHYQSDHEESELTEKEIAFYEANNMPYKKLRDGEVLLIKGETEKIVN